MLSPIEDIKNRIDIVELIGSYVRLQKAGVNFKGNCPLHNEKTPSFIVSPAKQIWHCFGCSRGGDIFKFVMEIEGYEFPDALRFLADRAGVQVKREDPAVRSERNRLFAVLEEAANFFEKNLVAGTPSSGLAAKKYLKERGLKDETIKEFRVGYAPDEWRALFDHLVSSDFKAPDIERAGLAIKNQESRIRNQGYYDRFRGRIIFPIFDYNGRVVAFGGRIFPDKDPPAGGQAKYVNSPETMLYQKSKILYGLNYAKAEILRSGECVIVEGYMDVVMSWQAGVRNVVASSGTALTPGHLKILRRLCERILTSFDMDVAGEEAARRGIELALAENFEVRVVRFSEAKDPADLIKISTDLWSKYLMEAKHVVRFYIDLAEEAFKDDIAKLSREFQKSVLPAIASLASHLERAHWVREAGKSLGINEEAVWTALKNGTQSSDRVPDRVIGQIDVMPKATTRKQLLERRILGLCAKFPHFLKNSAFAMDEKWFERNALAALAALKGERAENFAEQSFLDQLSLEADIFLELVQNPEEEFQKCARELKREFLKNQLADISRKVQFAEKGLPAQAGGQASLPNLLEEFRNISGELAGLE